MRASRRVIGEAASEKTRMGKELELEPSDAVEFKGSFKDPVVVEVKVKNGTGKKMAFKIKCSDNDIFKIRPVMGILKDGESGTVKLTCTAKEKGQAPKGPHHFSLYELEAKDDAKSARKLWEDPDAKKKKRHAKAKAVFKEDKDADKKDDKKEKKEDDKKEEKKDDEKKDDKKEEEKKDEKKDDDKKEEKKEDGDKKEEEKKEDGDKKEEEKKDEEKKELNNP